jgi:hypothetical protein
MAKSRPTPEDMMEDPTNRPLPEAPPEGFFAGQEEAKARRAVEEQAVEALPAVVDPFTSAIDRLADVMSKREAAGSSSTTDAILLKLTEMMGQLMTAQQQQNALIANQQLMEGRARRPSNEVTPMISVFNRRGELLEEYQKPPLKCLMLIPWVAEWESLTREEVELLNLLEPGTFLITRNDKTKLKITVQTRMKEDGKTPSELLLNHETGYNNDNFRLMPSLSDMLREIIKQLPPQVARLAHAILTDEEEAAMIAAGKLTVSH